MSSRQTKGGAAGRGQPAPTARDKRGGGKRSTAWAQQVSPAQVRAVMQFYAPSAVPRRQR